MLCRPSGCVYFRYRAQQRSGQAPYRRQGAPVLYGFQKAGRKGFQTAARQAFLPCLAVGGTGLTGRLAVVALRGGFGRWRHGFGSLLRFGGSLAFDAGGKRLLHGGVLLGD